MSVRVTGALQFNSQNGQHTSGYYLLRDYSGTPFVLRDVLNSLPAIETVERLFLNYTQIPKETECLVVEKLTKKCNFLRRSALDPQSAARVTKSYSWLLRSSSTISDTIQAKYAIFGIVIASLMRELEITLIVKAVSGSLLRPMAYKTLEIVKLAITTRSAYEAFNYKRLEFLGDLLLKYCAIVQTALDRIT